MNPDELKAAGWTVDKALLYDEEGVEGWTWTGPDGKERTVIGDWSDPPPVPEEFTGQPREPDPKPRGFADFLDGLLKESE